MYKIKYLKYKQKYLNFKNQIGSSNNIQPIESPERRTFNEPPSLPVRTFNEPPSLPVRTFNEPTSSPVRTFNEPPSSPVRRRFNEPPSSPVRGRFNEPPSSPVRRRFNEPPSSPVRRRFNEPPSSPVRGRFNESPSSPVRRRFNEPPSSPVRGRFNEPPSSPVRGRFNEPPSSPVRGRFNESPVRTFNELPARRRLNESSPAQNRLFANLSQTLSPVQLFGNRLETPSPIRRRLFDDDSGMPSNLRGIYYDGPTTPENNSLQHLNPIINETYRPNTILFPNIPFESQIVPNLVDGLFVCEARFNKFIENLRKKEDIIIPRNNPKLLRLKNYLQINDILDKGKLNCYSLLLQTILSLEQGSFEQSNLINHNFDIRFARQVGIDTGGLRREYLDILSKEIPYIFKLKNQTLELNGKLNNEYLLVILEMIYKTKCSIVSNFNILYLFKHYFIGPDKNIIELIHNTEYLSVSFSKLLLNFINYNYQNVNLEQIKESLKVKEYVLGTLFLFGSYLNDSMLPPPEAFTYIIKLTESQLIETWSDYNIGPKLTKFLSDMDRTYPSYNLFQLHSHFQYNEYIDSELLISRINFVNIDDSLKENFKLIIRDYKAALDAYTGTIPEIIKANADYKIQFGDQQEFLKHLLRYWSGSSYVHTEYVINYNELIDDLFHARTCFFQIETKVNMDINLYDLVYNLIIRFTTEFNTAG